MKANFIMILIKNNPKRILLSLLFFSIITCDSDNNNVIQVEKKTFQENTIVIKGTNYKKTIKKEIKKDTLIIEKNDIISFDDNILITKKGKKQVLSKNIYRYGIQKLVIIIKIENDDYFFSDCNDPICVLIIFTNKNKIVNFIKIPIIYKEDFELSFKDRFNRYYFQHYFSPDGSALYYILDAKTDIFYKTDIYTQSEIIFKNSFNFNDKTFKTKNIDNNKEIMKNLIILTKINK